MQDLDSISRWENVNTLGIGTSSYERVNSEQPEKRADQIKPNETLILNNPKAANRIKNIIKQLKGLEGTIKYYKYQQSKFEDRSDFVREAEVAYEISKLKLELAALEGNPQNLNPLELGKSAEIVTGKIIEGTSTLIKAEIKGTLEEIEPYDNYLDIPEPYLEAYLLDKYDLNTVKGDYSSLDMSKEQAKAIRIKLLTAN